MRGLCYTCLSQDRNVKNLDNLIKSILGEWFEVGTGNFKVNLDEFRVCWECIAWFIKISKFKHQVFTSQKMRLQFAQNKSSSLRNLSQLSTYTKNIYDKTYEYVEVPSGLSSLSKSQSDTPSNEGQIPKMKDKRKSDNGKHKLSITLRKNKEKVAQKRSKHSDYNSHEIKENSNEDNTDETDSNDNKKRTSKNDNGKIDVLSILNVRDLSEDVKLRSQAYVLVEREKRKKVSNHSKHRHRKRKRRAASDEVEKKKAKKHKKTDVTDVGKKTTKIALKSTNVGPNADNVDPNTSTSEVAAQNYSEPTPDLPEVKFTIVHLTEDQMLETRRIDRNDRTYGNRAFKCQTCIIGFLEISQFEKHNSEKHSVLNGPLVCRICNIRFTKQAFLQLHQETHYRSYRCRQCPFEHHRRYVIENHVVKQHGLKPSPVCPNCDMEFDAQRHLISHYETVHKDMLKCNICGDSFDTYARVRKHAAMHKLNDEDNQAQNAYCADCNIQFSRVQKYKQHLEETKNHTLLSEKKMHKLNDEDYPAQNAYCADCNIQFSRVQNYKQHLEETKNHTLPSEKKTHKLNDEDYPAHNAYCADCNIQFSRVHKYKQHLEESKKHTLLGENKFDCAHCTSKYVTKEELLAHIVRAHRLLSHTCALCNKGFSDQIRLTAHIQDKHTEVVDQVMDKICQICGKRFSARSALLDHMRSHTAEKPYQCKTCEKRFAVEPLLKKHIQRMHQ